MTSRKSVSAQVPIRGKGDNQCPHHQTEVVLSCTDCGGELVCLKCTTTTHRCHAFKDISDIAVDKKN